jgi:uncharacterized protein
MTTTSRPVTLVTGASSGIGREIALCAAADGHDLVVAARSAARLAGLATLVESRHGATVTAVPVDLAEPGGVRDLVAALGGRVPDVLVNNAGVGGKGKFAVERDLAADLAMVALNVVAVTELTGLLLPGMVARGSGGILNVASTAGFLPGPNQAIYYASKAFVKSFSEAIAEESRPAGVRVTALCPGPVDTGFAEAAGLEETLLMRFSVMKVPAADVARAGWEGLKAGRAVVVPGLLIRAGMQGLRVMPRRLAAQFAARTQA